MKLEGLLSAIVRLPPIIRYLAFHTVPQGGIQEKLPKTTAVAADWYALILLEV
jgi:hypothetical protein